MGRTLTAQQMVENAQRALRARTDAVEALATAHVEVTKAQQYAAERRAALEAELIRDLAAVERAEVSAYNAAVNAGWTEKELTGIGIPTPAKKAKAASRKRSTPKQPKPTKPSAPADAQTEPAPQEPVDQSQQDHEG